MGVSVDWSWWNADTGTLNVFSEVAKTEEELQEILIRKEAQMKEKQERKKKQEQDVAQKKALREENKWVLKHIVTAIHSTWVGVEQWCLFL